MENRTRKILKIIGIILISIFIALTFCFFIAGIVYGVRSDLSKFPLSNSIDQKILSNVNENLGDVRIMSSNLLVHYKSWGGKPVKPRASLYLALLEHYKPDVVGLQELSEEWFAVLNRNMPKSYTMLYPFQTGVGIHLTQIVYNKETLKLILSGEFAYKEKDNVRLRRVNYGIFEDKLGHRFGVTNTHLSLLFKGKEEKYKSVMQSQAKELVDFVIQLNNTYNCPIFSVGDFNASEGPICALPDDNPSIYSFLTKTLTDTKPIAINKLCGIEQDYIYPTYDHIFAYGHNYEVKTFNILSHDYLSEISDHFPIFSDISLK